MCPLLVATPDGVRCSVNTAEVRPFWGRAAVFYGGAFASLYLLAALSIFIFLRSVGYPVSIVHLVWPGSWDRVTQARGWFFLERSKQAFAEGRPTEGMLYLTNAFEFDPSNYTIGLALAQRLQLGQPARADEIYRRLLKSHPENHTLTSRAWFRSLLARGDFSAIQELAAPEVLRDSPDASVWMRALIFATRQTGNTSPLSQLLDSTDPNARRWHPLLETEIALRFAQLSQARARLRESWDDAPAYSLFYQVRELTALGDGLLAADLLGKYRSRLDDTTRAALLLDVYATLEARHSHERLADNILGHSLNPATLRLIAVHLIRHPNPALLAKLFNKMDDERLPLNDASLEGYLAFCCAAGIARDWPKMKTVIDFIRGHGDGNAFTLTLLQAFFRGDTSQTRIAALLPALPMGLEAHYALLERYPGTIAASAPQP